MSSYEAPAHFSALPAHLAKFRGAAHDLHRQYSHLITPTFDSDDLASVIVSSFLAAYDSYEDGRGNIVGWMCFVARRRIFYAYRHIAGPVTSRPAQTSDSRETRAKQRAAMFREYLDEPVRGFDVCRKDILVNPYDIAIPDRVDQLECAVGGNDLIRALTDCTSPSERELLFACYGISPYPRKTQSQLASELGCKRHCINYRVGCIIQKLRKSWRFRKLLTEIGYFPRGGMVRIG